MNRFFLYFLLAIAGVCCMACSSVYIKHPYVYLIGLGLVLNFAIKIIAFYWSEEFSHGMEVGRSSTKEALQKKVEATREEIRSKTDSFDLEENRKKYEEYLNHALNADDKEEIKIWLDCCIRYAQEKEKYFSLLHIDTTLYKLLKELEEKDPQ